MAYVFVPHLINDRVQRLAVGRAKALEKRGARWAAPRDGVDNNVKMRTEEISKEGSRSHIDTPTPFWKVNSKRKEKA